MSSRAKRVGFYGGSFDPIHFGHLNLALELKEKCGLDEVWFCPARLSPHKLQKVPEEASKRLEMVRLAVEGIDGISVLDYEINREGPSYTIDTLRYLTSHEACNFRLLLGEDALYGFFHWKEPQQIIQLAPPLIGCRFSSNFPGDLQGDPKILNSLKEGWTPIRGFDISSTEIRERLKKRLYCGHLIPQKALDFIIKKRLYSEGYEESRPASA